MVANVATIYTAVVGNVNYTAVVCVCVGWMMRKASVANGGGRGF